MASIPAQIYKDDVLAIAPELSTLSSFLWADILAFANEIDLGPLGETAQMTRMCRLYLSAHSATLTKRAGSGAAGPVTSESAGALRRSYGLVALSAGQWLGSTMYGQMLETLLNMSAARGPMLV